MIITDKEQLRIPCVPCTSVDEGMKIAKLLWEEFNNHEAIGLAANQIGINKRVFVMDTQESLSGFGSRWVWINPELILGERKVIVKSEGCLSFPDELVMTERYSMIRVSSLNHPHSYTLSEMEAICFQHELDHLDGIIMHDRQYRPKS